MPLFTCMSNLLVIKGSGALQLGRKVILLLVHDLSPANRQHLSNDVCLEDN